MAKAVTLKDYQGVECYPKSHEKQIVVGQSSLDKVLIQLQQQYGSFYAQGSIEFVEKSDQSIDIVTKGIGDQHTLVGFVYADKIFYIYNNATGNVSVTYNLPRLSFLYANLTEQTLEVSEERNKPNCVQLLFNHSGKIEDAQGALEYYIYKIGSKTLQSNIESIYPAKLNTKNDVFVRGVRGEQEFLVFNETLKVTATSATYQEYRIRLDQILPGRTLYFRCKREGVDIPDAKGGIYFYDKKTNEAKGVVQLGGNNDGYVSLVVPDNAYCNIALFINRTSPVLAGTEVTFSDIDVFYGRSYQGYNFYVQGSFEFMEVADLAVEVVSRGVGDGTQVGYAYANGKEYYARNDAGGSTPYSYKLPRLSFLYFNLNSGKLEVSTEKDKPDCIQLLFNPTGKIEDLQGALRYYIENKILLVQAVTRYPNYKIGGLNMISRLGSPGPGPEQSIPRFYNAFLKGYNILLADVRETSDGIFVALHDDTINSQARNEDGSEIKDPVNIKDITYSEALKYDFGIKYGQEYKGLKILNIEDFLQFCKYLNVTPFLEMKCSLGGGEKTKKLIRLVKKYNLQDNIMIQCPKLNTPDLKAFAEALPKVILGIGSIGHFTTEEIDIIAEIPGEHEKFIHIGNWQNPKETIKADILATLDYAIEKNVFYNITNFGASDIEWLYDNGVLALCKYISADVNMYDVILPKILSLPPIL